jgi:hypothetical protein
MIASALCVACGPPTLPGGEGFGTGTGEEQTSSGDGESGTESTETGDGDGDPGDGDGDGDGDGEPACVVDLELGSELPIELSDTIVALPSERIWSCGGAGSERSYSWTAPAAGRYRFETVESVSDVVLVLADGCDGPELACNEDLGSWTHDAQVNRVLDAGETVTVFVDALFPEIETDYGLRIHAIECPQQLLTGPLPISVTGSTLGVSNEMGSESVCGGGQSGEHAYLFTAPAAGTYVFDTIGSSFDTSLWVYAGECGTEVLGCNNDFEAEVSTDSWIAVELDAEQTVTVAVDGWIGAEGDYQLNVDSAGPSPGECPDEVLPMMVPQQLVGSTLDAGNNFFGDCGGQLAPDRSYRFTAPVDGIYSFSTVGSSFDTSLSVRDACGSTLEVCNDDIDWFTEDARVVVELLAGESRVVIVDGHGSTPGAFALSVELVTCVDEAAPASTRWSTAGATLGGIDRLGSQCGGDEAPDWIVEWVAPASGNFVLSTLGSDYDTVLHARGQGCGGPVMSCNDDAFGVSASNALSSKIEVTAIAGEAVLIAVDGSGSDAGQFELSLEPACDPLAPACPPGQVCGRSGGTFSCRAAVDVGEGETCGGDACGDACGVCNPGLVCVSGLVHPDCGESCCDRACDLDAPSCGPGEVCTPLLAQTDAAPWHADVGYCL